MDVVLEELAQNQLRMVPTPWMLPFVWLRSSTVGTQRENGGSLRSRGHALIKVVLKPQIPKADKEEFQLSESDALRARGVWFSVGLHLHFENKSGLFFSTNKV